MFRWLKPLCRLMPVLLLLPLAGICSAAGSEPPRAASAEKLSVRLQRILEREGYIGQFRNGQQLQRGVSAYLWDNRRMLKQTDFHAAKQVDVLVCLLLDKGYDNFAEYGDNKPFTDWCGKMIK